MFDLAIDSKLRGCDLVKIRIRDVVAGPEIRTRAIVIQQKTGRPVQFEITGDVRASLLAWLERRGGTVGFPLPGVGLRVRDDQGREMPAGDIGNIEVKGPNVFKGYWRMPEKTAEEFTKDGYFKTGDVGKVDERGYVHIVGRSKDLIISGGYNVYPAEIEGYINDMPGVAESALVGVPHPDFGEVGVAVVIAKPGAKLDADAIVAQLKSQLANFKIPKKCFVVSELPRNTMGKVQKNLLRERHKQLFTSA